MQRPCSARTGHWDLVDIGVDSAVGPSGGKHEFATPLFSQQPMYDDTALLSLRIAMTTVSWPVLPRLLEDLPCGGLSVALASTWLSGWSSTAVFSWTGFGLLLTSLSPTWSEVPSPLGCLPQCLWMQPQEAVVPVHHRPVGVGAAVSGGCRQGYSGVDSTWPRRRWPLVETRLAAGRNIYIYIYI